MAKDNTNNNVQEKKMEQPRNYQFAHPFFVYVFPRLGVADLLIQIRHDHA
jgi:hypothetical protein